jgi:glycine dehydrogenase subunit 2
MMHRTGRPTAAAPGQPTEPDHETAASLGHRGLDHEEPLIFEQGEAGRTGVDLPEPSGGRNRLGALARSRPIGLPGLSEPQVVRHFVRLSRKNYAIDQGIYPLGSCTMKHNPRLNEKVARMAGLGDLHPLQPESTVQGAMELIDQLRQWIAALTGMPVVAMPPAAGAQGELCGLMTIRAALIARGDARKRVLVAESAHGTNPATAAACDYEVLSVATDLDGRINLSDLKAKLDQDVAAVMLTNPNTCGIFETGILEVARMAHGQGAYLYVDGANFNAIVGRVRPGDLGVDVMHLNLHKTFSTPHGGGGPGSGPVAMIEELRAFIPVPFVERAGAGGAFRLVEHASDAPLSVGRLKAFHGQMGMFIRALAYMQSHGADGLRQVAEDAVLNANYIRVKLSDVMSAPFPGRCMHEALFDDRFLADTGVTTLDIAKALIDEGYHPMTIYFPLIVHGAMLIEPTETESKESLDAFIASLRKIARIATSGAANAKDLANSPRLAPRKRLDETLAARKPVLRWREKS